MKRVTVKKEHYMELTIEERLTAYKLLLKLIDTNAWECGFCYMLTSVLNIPVYGYEVTNGAFKLSLPELYANRPHDTGMWFPYTDEGLAERRKILVKTIEEMEK